MTRALVCAAVTLLVIVRLAAGVPASAGYPDGAPPGFSGGFGEESCHACHFQSEPNSSPGKLTLAGVPDQFAAGERYTLTITLTRAGMKNAGFQLTSRFKDGGAQAGTLASAADEDKRIRIDAQSGIQYAVQRLEGTTLAAPDTARWTLTWSAPADAGGPVVFHVAANAADNDESVRGDYIYLTSQTAIPRR